MELIRGLHNLRECHRGCVATIGNFDGVHLGHQAILDQLRDSAVDLNLPVTVVVFEPQPREFFAGDQAPPRLTRLRDKARLLAAHGAERIVCLPFNDALRSLTGRQFIDRVLIDGLNVHHLVVGDDFRFGCDRSGDFALLTRVGEECGFDVENTRTFALDDERVSSSRVRTLLASGNFLQAARMLGRPYSYTGRVVPDQKLGRTIGVPTANVPLLSGPMALRGVYAVITRLSDGREFAGVANIGWRPTVGTPRPVLEVNLFDFSDDLYGQIIEVLPCARLRGEQRFDGLDGLKHQIQADQVQAREFFHAWPVQTQTNSQDDSDLTPYLASAPMASIPGHADPGAARRDNDGTP